MAVGAIAEAGTAKTGTLMLNQPVFDELCEKFRTHFGFAPTVAAYAPGRIEVLGNHTDYNEGLVLSAAINLGTFFVAAPLDKPVCRLVAGDLMQEAVSPTNAPLPVEQTWANYVFGLLPALLEHKKDQLGGCAGMFLGNIPLGAGLSSSAALELSALKALCALYNVQLSDIEQAKTAQWAEHHFAGCKCGLLDQFTSLMGTEGHLVLSDFRSMSTSPIPLGNDVRFLVCNTHARHTLVDGAYNERRKRCEEAASAFSALIARPISTLRDVTWDEWCQLSDKLSPLAARRSAHVIGEIQRVEQSLKLLQSNQIEDFGRLMFASHASSQKYFENSAPELDCLVDAARRIPGVLGARLSGGGFGGSVIVLVGPRDTGHVAHALNAEYRCAYGVPCDIITAVCSAGARLICRAD